MLKLGRLESSKIPDKKANKLLHIALTMSVASDLMMNVPPREQHPRENLWDCLYRCLDSWPRDGRDASNLTMLTEQCPVIYRFSMYHCIPNLASKKKYQCQCHELHHIIISHLVLDRWRTATKLYRLRGLPSKQLSPVSIGFIPLALETPTTGIAMVANRTPKLQTRNLQ